MIPDQISRCHCDDRKRSLVVKQLTYGGNLK